MNKKFLAVDGNSIINRAFYGVRPLTTSDGRYTNAIYGFINMLMKQKEAINPDYALVAFDLKAPTFRHKSYASYKAGRKPMPDELFSQLEPCKQACRLLGFNIAEVEGFEADDILGTCAEICNQNNDSCYLLTGDRDSFQLVSENTTVLYASKNDTIFYDLEKIRADYGVEPLQLIEVKALMGDSSDNIPGVAGIGEKTALKIISECKTIERLYENPQALSVSASVKQKLADGKENAKMSRFLAEIVKNVPIDKSPQALIYHGIQKQALRDFLADFELKSLIKRFVSDVNESKESENHIQPSLFDGETQNTDYFVLPQTEPFVSCDIFSGKNVFCIISEDGENLYLLCEKKYYCISAENPLFAQFFSNPDIKKIIYDSKQTALHLLKKGIKLKGLEFDILLASYVADSHGSEGAYALLCDPVFSGVDMNNDTFKNTATLYAMAEKYASLKASILQNGQEKLYYEIELPLAGCLAKMEYFGFKADKEKLEEFSDTLSQRLVQIEKDIYDIAGGKFNINSPKQLAEVLFEKLQLPAKKKTKSGYSTDAETLSFLRPLHPIINHILQYRMLSKLKSTYCDGLLCSLDENNRIHTSFKQALTQTGRLSSTEPNLQNIPIRTEEGRELRKFFIPENENYVLIDADYSQIELRILAALSCDENMKAAFISGEDVHTTTASKVFGVEPENVSAELRKRAKAVNFGVVYGIGEYSLSQDIGVSVKEAAEYIKEYFSKFPGVDKYLKDSVENAERDGYVSTLFGRRRYIPELRMPNKNTRNFGKRIAMNTPIQGTAADIIKIAMVETDKELERQNLDARLILQVHDELIIESSKKDAEKAKEILVSKMQNAAHLSVPLNVTVGMGGSWDEAHD